MRTKKGAIQLSMSTIIIIIIGVTLLGLMLTWVSGIFGQIDDETKKAFEELETQIEEQMRPGQDFLVLGQSFKTPVDESLVIGIGVRNAAGFRTTVSITVAPDTGAIGNPPDANTWINLVQSGEEIEPNEIQTFKVIMKVPKTATSGDIALFKITADTGSGVTKTEPISIEVE
tara:strand:+ start:6220 stop:6738 length:519 start_codon:yes stop_codon:yes gene_type:complete